MQNENSRLKIHTSARPVSAPEEKKAEAEEQVRHSVRTTLFQKKRIDRLAKRRERGGGRSAEGMTVGEKLLRNTAVACALMLTIMSLKNIDQPWSRKVTEGVRQAMTMRIDWDDTLGRLSFVRSIMPETALVFLNIGSRTDLERVVEGEIVHQYSVQQPWIEFRCASAQQVSAATGGIVTAAGQGAGNEWIVLIQNADGVETVYGYLENVYVQVGQEVRAGQQIGATADRAESRLYFELREAGESVDPAGRMK